MSAIMPLDRHHRLALVLPGLRTLVHQGSSLPSLARLVALSDGVRATPSTPTHESWQADVLRALSLTNPLDFPSAPLSWIGAGGVRADGTWFHIDPVIMSMTSGGVALRLARPWSESQLRAVAQRLQGHLSASGLEWQTANGRAYLHAREHWDVQTMSLSSAISEPRDALPRGPDAPRLLRLLTELQMLLHDVTREAAHDADYNAVWLWGSGAISASPPRQLPLLFADVDFARGVVASVAPDNPCRRLPANAQAIVNATEQSTVVVCDATEALEQNWFAPILQALLARRWSSVELYIDGYFALARPSLWRRWFARTPPLTELFS